MESSSNFQIHTHDPALTKDENLRALALSIPVEEMFGSVTTYNTPDSETSGKFGQQLRTSARVIKKLKLDSSSSDRTSTMEENKSTEIPTKIRTSRTKVVWSPEDKSHFFDAIKEYGKDFDAIHEYMISKMKKKGGEAKTKEQIRHFFYRTWHKISKYLKFSDEVKKVVQEYYALINYGELRRKIGVTNEKTCIKLNELMYRGTTQVRIRGKTVRIKTPMCRTLRKLNQIDERPEDVKLPTKVLVELRPRDMDSWMFVQEIGQNPRVHCCLTLQKRLSGLLSHLNSRWRTPEQRAYEKALLNNELTEDKKDIPVFPVLHVAPKAGTQIQIPSITYSEFLTNCRISLNAYEERMGVKQRGESLWLASLNNNKSTKTLPKKSTKRVRSDSDSKNSGDPNDEIMEEHFSSPSSDDELKIKVEPNDIKIENIRNGWSIHDSESITIGELYLMIGNDAKITLEYWWEKVKDEEVRVENEISVALQKLLSLAKLYYRKEKVECPCGHVCGVTNHQRLNVNGNRNKNITLSRIHKLEARVTSIPEGVSTMEEISLSTKPHINPTIDGVFRLPFAPSPTHNLEDFKAKLESLRPKYCQRRGRIIRPKPVVVQRNLPLLPKTETNESLLSMKVIPQDSLASEFSSAKPTQQSVALSPISMEDDEEEEEEEMQEEDKTVINEDDTSTPTINTLLDMVDTRAATPKPDDSAIENSTFSDFLGDSTRGLATPLSASPSRLLKDDDAHWLNAEVADFSLSSFLGHLEASPMKNLSTPIRCGANINADDTRLSQDMEAQLQALMCENSIDYMAKFEELAAQMRADHLQK